MATGNRTAIRRFTPNGPLWLRGTHCRANPEGIFTCAMCSIITPTSGDWLATTVGALFACIDRLMSTYSAPTRGRGTGGRSIAACLLQPTTRPQVTQDDYKFICRRAPACLKTHLTPTKPTATTASRTYHRSASAARASALAWQALRPRSPGHHTPIPITERTWLSMPMRVPDYDTAVTWLGHITVLRNGRPHPVTDPCSRRSARAIGWAERQTPPGLGCSIAAHRRCAAIAHHYTTWTGLVTPCRGKLRPPCSHALSAQDGFARRGSPTCRAGWWETHVLSQVIGPHPRHTQPRSTGCAHTPPTRCAVVGASPFCRRLAPYLRATQLLERLTDPPAFRAGTHPLQGGGFDIALLPIADEPRGS